MAKKQIKSESKLQQAMQFLSVCQQDEAVNDSQTHCSIVNHTAVAFDGILAAGIMIDEDLNCCPHTRQMALALSRCSDTWTITQLAPETLQIRSGEFEAYIPCCHRERLTAANPDAGNIPVSAGLTSALEMAAPLASDKADALEAASLLIEPNSVLATNREMILEAWHGSALPFGGFLIPKMAAAALVKIKKQIIAIGIKPNLAALFPAGKDQNLHESITFWFADNSWLRTQLYKGKWRSDAMALLKEPTAAIRPIPQTFFDTVKKVMPFSEDDKVYCGEGKVASHYQDRQGAGYSLPFADAPKMKIYKGKNLLIAGKYSTMIDERHDDKSGHVTMFYGTNVRCAVWHDWIITDDDIPF